MHVFYKKIFSLKLITKYYRRRLARHKNMSKKFLKSPHRLRNIKTKKKLENFKEDIQFRKWWMAFSF